MFYITKNKTLKGRPPSNKDLSWRCGFKLFCFTNIRKYKHIQQINVYTNKNLNGDYNLFASVLKHLLNEELDCDFTSLIQFD